MDPDPLPEHRVGIYKDILPEDIAVLYLELRFDLGASLDLESGRIEYEWHQTGTVVVVEIATDSGDWMKVTFMSTSSLRNVDVGRKVRLISSTLTTSG